MRNFDQRFNRKNVSACQEKLYHWFVFEHSFQWYNFGDMHEPLLVKFMVKNWHKLWRGAINQDRGRLVHHHRVLCLILTSATQPTWREGCIYWRNNQTYKVYSKLSVTTSHEFKTRKWNKYNMRVPFASHPHTVTVHNVVTSLFLTRIYIDTAWMPRRERVAVPEMLNGQWCILNYSMQRELIGEEE